MDNSLYTPLYSRWVSPVLLFFFFAILAFSLLAPLSSNYIPVGDYGNHVSSISEAKEALKLGQFPVRTAPLQANEWGYPLFQFYSVLPYTIAGELCRTGLIHNPYSALKFVLWCALFLAGLYWFKITKLFTGSAVVGLLTGFAYMSAPYFLSNFIARGDFTEAVAQGLIPLVFYYTFLNYSQSLNLKRFFCNTLAWFALMTTHILTLIYFSGFLGLFFILLTLLRYQSWKRLIYLGICYLSATLLAAWFLIPIFLLHNILAVQGYDPFPSRWLTPLANLFSVTAVSPMPLPGNGFLPIPLYVAVGWPMLLAAGVVVYYLATRNWKNFAEKKQILLVVAALVVFLSAIFMAWTPVDIYRFLPKILAGAQYSYRLLTQAMWSGAILFIFAFWWAFEKILDIRHVVIGTLLLGFAASSWLPTLQSTPLQITELRDHPNLYYTSFKDYLIPPSYLNAKLLSHSTKQNTLSVQQTQQDCSKERYKTICVIANNSTKVQIVQLPILYYPKMLDIKLNGKKIHSYPTLFVQNNTQFALATIDLKPGSYTVTAYFKGIAWANYLSLIAWILALSGILFVVIKSIRFNLLHNKLPLVKS